jgi:hypothetical protein
MARDSILGLPFSFTALICNGALGLGVGNEGTNSRFGKTSATYNEDDDLLMR